MIAPTGGFGPIDLFAAPLDGVRRGVRQHAEAGERMAAGDVSAENMVDLIEANVLVKANIAVLRSADKMIGSWLDAKA
jgi:hypothetical protein